MKTTTKSLTYFRFISWLSIMFAFINIGISPIKAQRYSPRQIINVGTVVNSAIGGLVGGVFKAVGEQEGRRMLQSSQPYKRFSYVLMPNGWYYRVCQNYQNGAPISPPYWC